jgi:hypothetical protein
MSKMLFKLVSMLVGVLGGVLARRRRAMPASVPFHRATCWGESDPPLGGRDRSAAVPGPPFHHRPGGHGPAPGRAMTAAARPGLVRSTG